MQPSAIHIICLRVPYPLDIGANYDLYYKIKALHSQGVSIHLHCFISKGQHQQPILNTYCATVQYYKRTTKLKWGIPYIVSSRMHALLKHNLLQDNLPILIEGVHCSGILLDPAFDQRTVLLRAHNVEYLYYKGLAASTSMGLLKLYYLLESALLKKMEQKLAHRLPIINVSASDATYFTQEYTAKWAYYLPLFYEGTVQSKADEMGQFCLYHGNLEVAENEQAVIWLLENVFNKINVPFVIAGRNPSKRLIALSHKQLHTCIAANPSDTEMLDLVQKAQINLLPSINATGIKLKLLNALHYGKFCITNVKGANGFADKGLFLYAEDAEDMRSLILQYYHAPFTHSHVQQRVALLSSQYNMQHNARQLLTWLQ